MTKKKMGKAMRKRLVKSFCLFLFMGFLAAVFAVLVLLMFFPLWDHPVGVAMAVAAVSLGFAALGTVENWQKLKKNDVFPPDEQVETMLSGWKQGLLPPP